MRFLRRLFARLTSLVTRRRYDDRLREEIAEHVALQTAENLRAGLSPAQARRQALLKFGPVEAFKEDWHAERGMPFFESLLQDIRFGLRMLRKSPGFTAVAVLTLALGIGANTAIFSAVNGIWLEPLLNAHFSRMLIVDVLSMNEIRAIQEESTAFERTAIYRGSSGLILGGGTPIQASNTDVSGDFFSMLGVKPLLGRFILPPDTQPGHDLVAVMSYGLWMDDFGGDTRIVGRSITIDEKPYTVIGVMPKGFDLGVNWAGGNQGVWMPSAFPSSDPEGRGPAGSIVARLKPGVSISQVKSQLDTIYSRLVVEYPKLYPKELVRNGRYGWLVTAGLHGPGNPFVHLALSLLFTAVGFVLLMACVNVASLLVSRSWSRQRELTIRRTLGATRFRIIRQLLCESLLLAIAGGALGLFFSLWGIRVLRAIAPPYTPRVEYIRLDANVLWFTLVVSLLTAILIGLTPALHATSRRVGAKLKGGLSGSFAETTMRQSRVFRSSLVVLELALAMLVVVGGALMMRSFYLLMHVNTGIRADHLISMSVQLSDSTCKTPPEHTNVSEEGAKQSQSGEKENQSRQKKSSKKPAPDKYASDVCYAVATRNILDEIHSLSGIQQAALSYGGVFGVAMAWTSEHYPGGGTQGLWVEGKMRNELSGDVASREITPDFLAALGTRILRGRTFGQTDRAVPPKVAIVSESFARKYIPGDPLGKRFFVGEEGQTGNRSWMTIVGEVNDIRDRAVNGIGTGQVFYTPLVPGGNEWNLIARITVSPTTMVPAIERVVRSVDPDAPITHIETVDQIIAESSAQPRFQTVLLGSFGMLGLLLAMIGIYGVISYSVVQRTHEIGVRMALGAGRGDVLRMVLGEGLLLAFIGIAIGVAGALALTRFLRSLLFEIKPTDPATFIGVAILLALVAFAACYLPARRAMRVDPMVALRYE